jgi:hypothetical protein
MTSRFTVGTPVYYRLSDANEQRWFAGEVERVYKNGRFIVGGRLGGGPGQQWRPHNDGVTASPSGGSVSSSATMTVCDEESTPRVLAHNARVARLHRFALIRERLDAHCVKWRDRWAMSGALTDEMVDALELAVAKLPQPQKS